MSFFDNTKPLGLPDGSIRAIMALSFTFVTLGLWSTTGQPDVTLVAITVGIVQNYFTNRNVATALAEAPLPKPFIPGDEDTGK